MKKLELTIAGGWWWCDRCRKNHVECSPCPRDPNHVPVDGAEVTARLKKAVDKILESEALHNNQAGQDRVLEEVKKYIPEIESAYVCVCSLCGKWYESNNKRSAYCGC